MKKMLVVICLVVVLLCGCMGREANPISRYSPGDEKRTCASLRAEIADNDAQISKKFAKDASKFWSNAAWMLITPLAMDLKQSEKVEAEALQQRNKALKIIMAEKGCGY